MVNYCCECCNYLTERKSNYDKHLKSDKHLKKLGSCNNSINYISLSNSSSVISTITEPEFNDDTESILKIKDLENELKLKEQEIQNLKDQLKMKDEQIKMKDEIINILKQQPIPMQQPIQQPIQENKLIKSPKQIIENLTNSRKDALNIEEFIKNEIYNEKKNKYIKSIQFSFNRNNKWENLIYYNDYNKIAYIPNTENGLLPFTSFSNLVVNMFCSIIEKTDKDLCPIYCSDKRRNTFYIKMKDGWEKISEDNFNKVVNLIIQHITGLSDRISFNSKKLFNYYNKYYSEYYPNGFTQEESFENAYSHQIINLSATTDKNNPYESVSKYEEEDRKIQAYKVVGKHLASNLSKITCDDYEENDEE